LGGSSWVLALGSVLSPLREKERVGEGGRKGEGEGKEGEREREREREEKRREEKIREEGRGLGFDL
jgi:hypothetical protein